MTVRRRLLIAADELDADHGAGLAGRGRGWVGRAAAGDALDRFGPARGHGREVIEGAAREAAEVERRGDLGHLVGPRSYSLRGRDCGVRRPDAGLAREHFFNGADAGDGVFENGKERATVPMSLPSM